MKIMDATIRMSKFRGSMLGVLMGDCCGVPYEGDSPIETVGDRLVLKKCLDKLEGPYFTAPKKPYSDDTAMTISVAKTLIKFKGIDSKDLATNFVKDYFKNPNRGYGRGTMDLFAILQKEKIADPLGPAKDQFQGTGSYGNGGAMRVAPVALFCHSKSEDELIEMIKKTTEITHTHRDGINGSILQALAIRQSFNRNLNESIDPKMFISSLEESMAKVEKSSEDSLGIDAPTPYGKQLKEILRLLFMEFSPSDETVINVLGTRVSALYSVPTAIYCFLKSLKEIPGIQTTNPLRRSIEYAITLGGDTDTIASMTGAISGAFYGDAGISKNLMQHCEGYESYLKLTEELYGASISSKK